VDAALTRARFTARVQDHHQQCGKKNVFSPEMMAQMFDALTTLHNNEECWVGLVCAAGSDFTAGLDMPKFFGPTEAAPTLSQRLATC
jgi:enoyl-CoA hydratase/carnithine racemase